MTARKKAAPKKPGTTQAASPKKAAPREIELIVVHCSDTYDNQRIGAKEIDEWHKERGFDCIGYHFVITREGNIENGRNVEVEGAHVKGHNHNSIGLCWVGGKGRNNQPEDNRTWEQKKKLPYLLSQLKKQYPQAKIVGHNELDKNKPHCPGFNVANEYRIVRGLT